MRSNEIINPYRNNSPPSINNNINLPCSHYKPRSIFLIVVGILALFTVTIHKLLTSSNPEIILAPEKPLSLRGSEIISKQPNIPVTSRDTYSIHKNEPIPLSNNHNSLSKDIFKQNNNYENNNKEENKVGNLNSEFSDPVDPNEPSEIKKNLDNIPSLYESIKIPPQLNNPDNSKEKEEIKEETEKETKQDVEVKEKVEKEEVKEVETKEEIENSNNQINPSNIHEDKQLNEPPLVVGDIPEVFNKDLEIPTEIENPPIVQLSNIAENIEETDTTTNNNIIIEEKNNEKPIIEMEKSQESIIISKTSNTIDSNKYSVDVSKIEENEIKIETETEIETNMNKEAESKIENDIKHVIKTKVPVSQSEEEKNIMKETIETIESFKNPIPDLTNKSFENILFWLSVDNGVNLNSRGHVSDWNNQIKQNSYSFKSLSPSRLVQANSALMNEYRSDMKRHPESAGVLSIEQQCTTYSPKDSLHNISSINFPCALVSSNPILHLEESSTLFFVLKSEYPGKDDRSPGQKFFGHYPSGQFRILNGEASFLANGADYIVTDKSLQINPNKWNLLVYRFTPIPNKGIKVEISVNGNLFQTTSPSDWTANDLSVLFTKDSLLHVGGVTGSCGFIGKMAEILVFNSPLNNDETKLINEYFLKKYNIEIKIDQSKEVKNKKEGENEIIQLKTDSEAEIEITPNGIKRSIEDKNWDKLNNKVEKEQKEEEKEESNESINNPISNSKPILEKPINEFDLEKAEVERKQNQNRNSYKQVNNIERNENENSLENEKQKDKYENKEFEESNSQSEKDIENENQQQESKKVVKIREPIVDRNSAGIGNINSNKKSDPNSTPNESVCSTNIDPYKDVPIETFTPPRNADLADVLLWEDAVTDLKDRVKQMTIGGKLLRDAIKKEVRQMQVLRFKTFCKYY